MADTDIAIRTNIGELELYEGLSVTMNISIKDAREPLGFLYEYSNTITIPATQNNKKALGLINIPRVTTRNIDPRLNIPADITIEGEIFRSGSIKILNVIFNEDRDTEEFEIEFISSVTNIKEKLEELELRDLDLSEFDHVKNKTNIVNSWDNKIKQWGVDSDFELGKGYVYPLIDYGGRVKPNVWEPKDMKPAVYAKTILDKILNDVVGVGYSSDFLNSEYFRRLIIPGVAREGLTEAQKRNRRSRAILGDHPGYPSTHPSALKTSLFPSKEFYTETAFRNKQNRTKLIDFKDDNNNGVKDDNDKKYDKNDNYDTGTGKFTAPAPGRYKIESHIQAIPVLYYPHMERGFGLGSIDYDVIQFSPLLTNGSKADAEQRDYSYIKLNLVKEDTAGNKTIISENKKYLRPNVPKSFNKATDSKYFHTSKHLSDNAWIGFLGFGVPVSEDGSPAPVHNISITSASGNGPKDIYLEKGEKIYIEIETYIGSGPIFKIRDKVNGNYFDDVLATGSDTPVVDPGQMFVDIQASNTQNYLEVSSSDDRTVDEGTEFSVQTTLPKMSLDDFISSIFRMFNLYILKDPTQDRLRIEPFKDAISKGATRDWSDRIDRDAENTMEIVPDVSSQYTFKYSDGSDKFLSDYNERYDVSYGTKEVRINTSGENQEELQVGFTATVNDLYDGKNIPRVTGQKDDDEPSGYKRISTEDPKILFYGGFFYTNNAAFEFKDSSGTENFNKYPYAGHMNGAHIPDEDLNFGWVKEVPWNSVTTNTVYNKFHHEWIKNITDPRSHILNVKMQLSAKELKELDLNDTIFVDGSTYLINKMNVDLSALNELQEVELIHMPRLDVDVRRPEIIEIDNDGVVIDLDPIGPREPREPIGGIDTGGGGKIIPIDAVNIRPERSIISRKSQDQEITLPSRNIVPNNSIVQGVDNFVSERSSNVLIVGDSNTVGPNTDSVFIKGSNNRIVDGVTNVTLIGTNGVTVERSDIIYYGNQSIQEPDNDKPSNNREIYIGGRDKVDEAFKYNREEIVVGGRNTVRELGSDLGIYIVFGGRNGNEAHNSDNIKG